MSEALEVVMNVDDAARRLAMQVTAPAGAVTVLAWHGDDAEEIRVWFEGPWEWAARSLPGRFEGFRVRIEKRPSISTH